MTETSLFGVTRLPGHVHFGSGSRFSLVPAVAALGSRVFMVVDPFLAETPAFHELHECLISGGLEVTVFTEIVPELPLPSIDAAVEAARTSNPEVVVGYGGGSALDLAKLVSVLLCNPGPLSLYYGENRITGAILPVIAVPTTAGTGSEVTPVAVISDPDRELKVGISSPLLVPRVAIVDPELTVGSPASVTAHAGIDALVHAVESYTAAVRPPDWSRGLPVFVGRNKLSSVLALEAISAIGSALPQAVSNPTDIAARESMAWGSLLAGMAFGSAGTHLSHALQYPIGALTKTPHGLGTGLMLPYVLQACLESSERQLGEIADRWGLCEGRSDRERAQAAIDYVADIVTKIGIPKTLMDIGITESQVPKIVKMSLGVTRLAGNASCEATPELLSRILKAALTGDRASLS